jgi:hypothetical protein
MRNSKVNNIDYYEYQEYYFNNNNKIYKIIVEKRDNLIIIKNSYYMINFNYQELSLLLKENFNDTYEAYEYIINIFEQNKVKIENIVFKKEMKLILFIKESKVEIILQYNKINNNYFIDEINKLKNDITDLKNENDKLKKIISKINTNTNINTKKEKDDYCPKDIEFLEEITNDAFSSINIDNTFTTFESIDNILYLIYSNMNKSIICYYLNEKEICQEIKNAHNSYITNFKHYLDKINNRDLILSISQSDNNIKLWQVKNWECLLNIPHANSDGILYSSSFINDDNNIYIVTSNCNWDDNNEYIKIYDFNGKKIKEINDSNEITFFIDVYYDELHDNNYIITGNLNCIKLYDYKKNELYKKYYDKNNETDNNCHFIVIINKNEKSTNILESCDDGNIRIWDFFSGILIKKIKVNEGNLYGMCLWNKRYLFVGCSNKNMILLDLDEGAIKDLELKDHNKSEILTIKKINHYQYGECLISQGLGNDQIKLWTNKK